MSGAAATKPCTNTSQYYVAGHYVKIQEDYSHINKNLQIRFSKLSTQYTLNFPETTGIC